MASEGFDLGDLHGREPGRPAGPAAVGQPGHAFVGIPATPVTHGVDVDVLTAGDLGVGVAGRGITHEPRPDDRLIAGVSPSPSVIALWHEVQEHHMLAWRNRTITFQEQRRRRLRDFLPAVGVSVESPLDDIFNGYLHCYEASWRAFDDVAAALAAVAAAGLATAVLTNGTTAQQNDKLTRTGLADRIGPVWTVEDLGVAKPDPAEFAEACTRWGLPPDAVLSVGDRHDLDILPARKAGLAAVLLDRSGPGPAHERHRVISLREPFLALPFR